MSCWTCFSIYSISYYYWVLVRPWNKFRVTKNLCHNINFKVTIYNITLKVIASPSGRGNPRYMIYGLLRYRSQWHMFVIARSEYDEAIQEIASYVTTAKPNNNLKKFIIVKICNKYILFLQFVYTFCFYISVVKK